jgi:multidrug efflux pump subunit AcrB
MSDVESMWLAAGDGTLVPFSEVARIKEGRAYATIKRKDLKRTVTVSADVDQAVGNARWISDELAAIFPQLEREFPGVSFEFGGQAREFAKSFDSLRRDFIIAALLIFVILTALFKSYVQPLIVMTAIPFGIIGAVAGHFAMGYPITILSLIGLVALSGIVVNDSLILVDWINRRRAEGVSAYEAIIQGGRARMRAIMLTSITTILGLAPLLLETSFQARFLIPMGISIAAGVAFATVLTLLAIPALYMIAVDMKQLISRTRAYFGFAPLPMTPPIGSAEPT